MITVTDAEWTWWMERYAFGATLLILVLIKIVSVLMDKCRAYRVEAASRAGALKGLQQDYEALERIFVRDGTDGEGKDGEDGEDGEEEEEGDSEYWRGLYEATTRAAAYSREANETIVRNLNLGHQAHLQSLAREVRFLRYAANLTAATQLDEWTSDNE